MASTGMCKLAHIRTHTNLGVASMQMVPKAIGTISEINKEIDFREEILQIENTVTEC